MNSVVIDNPITSETPKDRLSLLIKENHYKREQIVELLKSECGIDIDVSTVTAHTTGKCGMSYKLLFGYSKIFDVNPEWLNCRSNNREPVSSISDMKIETGISIDNIRKLHAMSWQLEHNDKMDLNLKRHFELINSVLSVMIEQGEMDGLYSLDKDVIDKSLNNSAWE